MYIEGPIKTDYQSTVISLSLLSDPKQKLIALKNRHSDIDNHHDVYYVAEKTTNRGVKKLSSSLMKQR